LASHQAYKVLGHQRQHIIYLSYLLLESGIDPAEHGAKMEDRFYNNKAFSVSVEV